MTRGRCAIVALREVCPGDVLMVDMYPWSGRPFNGKEPVLVVACVQVAYDWELVELTVLTHDVGVLRYIERGSNRVEMSIKSTGRSA